MRQLRPKKLIYLSKVRQQVHERIEIQTQGVWLVIPTLGYFKGFLWELKEMTCVESALSTLNKCLNSSCYNIKAVVIDIFRDQAYACTQPY